MKLWELDPRKAPMPLRKVLDREIHLWAGSWLARRARKLTEGRPKGTRHLLFAICDHYEPLHGDATPAVGHARVDSWRARYPQLASQFHDSEGRSPRHSFFFPGEQYDPYSIETLAEFCAQGIGEVEIHLHHDGDTRETLRVMLEQTLRDLGSHGVLSKWGAGAPNNAKYAWSFIHGNWCLANSRRDGRYCGVDNEIPLLYELGCYADLTFPSAPDATQPAIVNSIYYPTGDLSARRAYEQGDLARVGGTPRETLMMIEGPLSLSKRPHKLSVRIENGALQANDPATRDRLKSWVEQEVTVEGRPEWVFVKVHTHGAPEANAEALLGDKMADFHRALGEYNDGREWRLHYVTAREMFNIARAAIDGHTGSPASYYDYIIPPPERARAR